MKKYVYKFLFVATVFAFAVIVTMDEPLPQVNSVELNQQLIEVISKSNTDMEIIRLLLNEGADPNSTNITGDTPLILAVGGNIDVLRLLLEYSANINAQNYVGFTALMYAVMSDNPNVVALLLENGADRAITTIGSGKTALDFAQESTDANSQRIIELLQNPPARKSFYQKLK